MQNIKISLFKTIAAIAFIGLTVGGSAGTSRADAYGNSEPANQGATDTINNENTGSGTGGSTDTVTPDNNPGYHNDYQGPSYRNDQGGTYQNDQGGTYRNDSSTGSGTGGSTDTDTGGDRLMGTGPHYGTAPQGGPSGTLNR